MADGEWQVTTRKRGNKRDRNQAAHGHASLPAAHRETPVGTDNPTPEQVDRWRARVEATGADVAASAFFRHLQRVLLGATLAPTTPPSGGSSSSGDVGAVLAVEGANDDLSPGRAGRPASDRWALLPRIKSMVMYGLGSLEQPGGAHIRCQLALAVRLAAMLPGLEGRPEAYDPVFSGLDSQALASLGFTVLDRDEGGARVAATPTLFYLPHCEDSLTDALLAANLAAGTLHNVVVLGNKLSIYPPRWGTLQLPAHRGGSSTGSKGGGQQGGSSSHGGSGSKGSSHHGGSHHGGSQHGGSPRQHHHPRWHRLLQRPDTLLRLCAAGAVEEVAVDEGGYPVVSAFNDLALHTFPHDWRQRLDLVAGAAAPRGF